MNLCVALVVTPEQLSGHTSRSAKPALSGVSETLLGMTSAFETFSL